MRLLKMILLAPFTITMAVVQAIAMFFLVIVLVWKMIYDDERYL